MGAVTTSLIDAARTIFTDLGYDVTEAGDELRAERKWRTVHVTTAAPRDAPTHGNFRCFVTQADRAKTVQSRLLSLEPDYDWAVISIRDDGYHILHPESDVLSAP